MTPNEQLDEWVKGNSIHNTELGECCPDFSCCHPELLASEAERTAFRDADEKTRYSMLGMFLGAAISKAFDSTDVKVHILGDEEIPTA